MSIVVNEYDAKIAADFIANHWDRFVSHCYELAKSDEVDTEEYAERIYKELGGEL
ncbi:TPA: hypothetical protein QH074_004292 [Enterobacter hormaechei subsp. steigerwaltii]|nr:hypothetical protein [Enterobacter hormaechei subsp. steigerwaltii]